MNNFDQLLNQVLQEEAQAQPRAGIEGRVLARIRLEAVQPVAQWRWHRPAWLRPVPAAACLCVVLALCVVLVIPRSPHSSPVAKTSVPLDAGVAAAHQAPVVEPDAAFAGQSDNPPSPAKAAGPDASRRVVRRSAEVGKVPLPKLETFPAPAPVTIFPQPVAPNEGGPQLAALRSQKVAEALAKLQQEQNEPIRIAAIQIAPLQTEFNSEQNQ